jgi:hypothetical protein
MDGSRVAKWYIFKPKSPTLGTYIWEGVEMKNIGILYDLLEHLEHFTSIWYILRR